MLIQNRIKEVIFNFLVSDRLSNWCIIHMDNNMCVVKSRFYSRIFYYFFTYLFLFQCDWLFPSRGYFQTLYLATEVIYF